MSSTSPSLTILSEEQKFNGDNLLSWTTNMTQLLGAKGLLGYINGKNTLPTQTPSGTSTTHSTPIYSTIPTADEWHFHDQLTRGHITLNCTDVTGLGVKTTGTAKEAWDLIQTEWGTSMDMRRSHAQELLNKTTYAEGASVQDHIKLLRTRKAAVDNLSTTAMSDETWHGIIIRSIPPTPRWLPVVPSLYTLTSPADIISILLAHGMILDRSHGNQPTSNSSDTALAVHGTEGCTNPNCKAKMCSTHTTANCYWPGGGKEGQFPPNFGQRPKANSATLSSHETTQHFALSAWISKQRGTSYTVSEILIEDPDERSHHMSPTMGENIPLFDILFDTLDNIHTINNRSDAAVPDIRHPLTPDFTPTSIKTPTGTSTDVSGEENHRDIGGNTTSTPDEVGACNGNVLVKGKRVNLGQTDDDDNQPIFRLDEPRPGPDGIDRPTTLHTPHTEEDPTETNDYLTNSFVEGGAGYKTTVTPGTDELPNEKLPLAQPEKQGEHIGKVANGRSGEIDWDRVTVDGAGSIRHLYINQIPAQFDFDGAGLVLKLTDLNTTLLEEPPQVSSNQFGGGGGASWINPREHTRGAMNLDTMNHNFRALEGKEIIKLVSIVEKDHLLVFQDPGEAPQHRRVDYRPIVDARHIPGRPRKVAYVLSTRAEQDNGFDTDLATRSGQPVWEIFPPPPEINKRLTIPRASTKRGGTGENLTSSCPSRVLYITERGGGASKLSNNDGNISGNNLTTTHFQPTDLNPLTGTRSALMPPRMIPTLTGDISTNFTANRQTFHIRELYYLHHLRFTHGQVRPTT